MWKSTLFHTIELAVIIGATVLIINVLNIDGQAYQVLVGLVLAALTKFVRANDSIPIKDYVNE